jgi:nicotinamide riboside kinase
MNLTESIKKVLRVLPEAKQIKKNLHEGDDDINEDDVDKIVASQEKYIKKTFGAKAAQNANYAWSIDGDVVSTKVYGKGVLISQLTNTGVDHDFEQD